MDRKAPGCLHPHRSESLDFTELRILQLLAQLLKEKLPAFLIALEGQPQALDRLTAPGFEFFFVGPLEHLILSGYAPENVSRPVVPLTSRHAESSLSLPATRARGLFQAIDNRLQTRRAPHSVAIYHRLVHCVNRRPSSLMIRSISVSG